MGEAGETASTTEGAAPCARQLRKLMRRPGLLAVVVVLGLISAGTIIEIGLATQGESVHLAPDAAEYTPRQVA